MRRLAIHAAWTARQAIYRAYDRHCESGGMGLVSPVLWGTALVCLVSAPWHPWQLPVAAAAIIIALASGPERGRAGRC